MNKKGYTNGLIILLLSLLLLFIFHKIYFAAGTNAAIKVGYSLAIDIAEAEGVSNDLVFCYPILGNDRYDYECAIRDSSKRVLRTIDIILSEEEANQYYNLAKAGEC